MSRYDELAEKATPRPWKIGKACDWLYNSVAYLSVNTIVYADSEPHDDNETADAELITTLVNAAPDIAALWKAAEAFVTSGDELTRLGMDDAERLDHVHRAVEALRPLFGEAQS